MVAQGFGEGALEDDVATEVAVAEHAGVAGDDEAIILLGDGLRFKQRERYRWAVVHRPHPVARLAALAAMFSTLPLRGAPRLGPQLPLR